jgi:hypothetical protein
MKSLFGVIIAVGLFYFVKLLIKNSSSSEDNETITDEASYDDEENSTPVSRIIAQAEKYYPNNNPRKAAQSQDDVKGKSIISNLENEIVKLTNTENPDTKLIAEKIKEFSNVCKDWRRLRDLANSLSKTSISKDFAWSLYNKALLIGGSRSTIYEPMAQLRKKERNYYDATRLFIMALADSPTKSCENQIRICLGKMGFKKNAETLKNDLVNIISEGGGKKALEKLESLRGQLEEK